MKLSLGIAAAVFLLLLGAFLILVYGSGMRTGVGD